MSQTVNNDANSDGGKRKRAPDSPEISEHHKRYLLTDESLIKNNRYYLPQHAEETLSETAEPQEKGKIKIPPIFLHDVNNYQVIIDDIVNVISEEFTTQSKNNALKINLTNIEDFRKLTKFYDNKKLKYHTFRDPSNTFLSVVIKNVPISLTENEIMELLQDKYPVKKIVRLLSKDKKPLPICVVDLENTEESKSIFNLNRLMHSVVMVEPRRKSHEIPQCTRCQRYGHTKNYCKLTPRCVKCNNNHHYSECTKRSDDPPICVNCGENHAANYRGCSYYRELKEKIYRNRSDQPTEFPNTVINQTNTSEYAPGNPNQNRRRNISYAEATADTRPSPRNSNPSPSNITPTSTQDPLTVTILNLITEIITPIIHKIKNFILNLIPSLLQNATI